MFVEKMERETTRKSVNNSRTRKELRIMSIKRGENFVKSIGYINDWTSYLFLLTSS